MFTSLRVFLLFRWYASTLQALGLPLFLRHSDADVTMTLMLFDLSWSSTSPMNFHFLLFTSLLSVLMPVLSSSSLVVTLSCHLIFYICLGHLWNTSMVRPALKSLLRPGTQLRATMHNFPFMFKLCRAVLCSKCHAQLRQMQTTYKEQVENVAYVLKGTFMGISNYQCTVCRYFYIGLYKGVRRMPTAWNGAIARQPVACRPRV